jgi:1,4-alpha-glucan branching enzyme
MPFDGGVTFRVWAPHAERVSVTGTFYDWDAGAYPLAPEAGGTWSTDVKDARTGDEYRFLIRAGSEEFSRIDPRARQLTSSVGNAVVYDSAAFDWGQGEFATPAWNDLVIYEMHVGTFSEGMHGRPGTLEGVRRRLGYLRELGIGAIQLMPPFEFAGDRSWGYNPAYPFAVESAYGHPDDLKALVRAAHEAGIAVLLDVVYNHRGRPTWTSGASTAGRRTTRAASTSTRTTAPQLPGATRDPTTADRRCATSCVTTP